MNNDGLQKLKEIGAQKIYEDTHIPVEHVQAIIHESFDGLTKIHFIGFISILQREYKIDLSELKNAGVAYYDEGSLVETITENGLFVPPKKERNFTIIYIVLAMVVFLFALYYTVEYAKKNMEAPVEHIDSTAIENAKKNIQYFENNDTNTTAQELNTTIKVAPVVEEKKALPKSLKIIPRSKVWMGYIDVQTNKKYQKTFQQEFDLDPKRDWLLIFGHGYVYIVIDGEKKKFSEKNTLRLLYKEGELSELTLDEFKRLNRGNSW